MAELTLFARLAPELIRLGNDLQELAPRQPPTASPRIHPHEGLPYSLVLLVVVAARVEVVPFEGQNRIASSARDHVLLW